MTRAQASALAWVDQFVISRAEGMTLYGRVESVTQQGNLLNITRFWRTPRDTSAGRPYDWEPYDRKVEAADWYRRPEECQVYDFAQPLYDCHGKKYTSSEALA